MSERIEIVVWYCDACGYWRKDKTTGRHATANPDDPNGKLITHSLIPLVFIHAPKEQADGAA